MNVWSSPYFWPFLSVESMELSMYRVVAVVLVSTSSVSAGALDYPSSFYTAVTGDPSSAANGDSSITRTKLDSPQSTLMRPTCAQTTTLTYCLDDPEYPRYCTDALSSSTHGRRQSTARSTHWYHQNDCKFDQILWLPELSILNFSFRSSQFLITRKSSSEADFGSLWEGCQRWRTL